MNKNCNLLISFICAVGLWPGMAAATDWTADQVATTRMEAKTFTSAGTKPIKVEYLLYLPKGYTNSVTRWPLMIYLHGAGERSENVFGVTWHGPPQLVRRGGDFPFIIVAPLCPPKQWGLGDTKLLHLLNSVEKEYRVDTNRVYLTGMSMGGSGTWSLGLNQAKRFAAIAPICGNVKPDFLKKLSPEQTEAIKSLPVWAFHGAKDTTVLPVASERMVEGLKKMGCTKALFTKYPNADHDSWTVTYKNAGFYQWLLKQKRQP